MVSRCSRCGKRLAVGDVVVLDLPEAVADVLTIGDELETAADVRHQRCPRDPRVPSPFDDGIPRRPGSGWIRWVAEGHGLDATGTNAEVARRLQRFGFEIEAPGDGMPRAPGPDDPHPRSPTTGAMMQWLRERFDVVIPGDSKAAHRAALMRALRERGYQISDDADDGGDPAMRVGR